MTHRSGTILGTELEGLLPGITHMQSPKPAVLRGRNFRWHLRGPYSGWGNSLISPPIGGVHHNMCATFRVENHTVLCCDTGIYRMDQRQCLDETNSCQWEPVCEFTPHMWPDDCDNDYPWTSAYVGDSWFFSHPTVGIIEYSRCKGGWQCIMDLSCAVPAVGGFNELAEELGFAQTTPPRFSGYETMFPATEPDTQLIAGPIFAITQSANQLIVLARDTVSWSAPDQGSNLACNIHTGAGFQSLSAGRYGRPLSVKETVDGFVTYTTNSMLQFIQTNARAGDMMSLGMYRMDEISTAHLPLNPWAIVQHDSKAHFFVAEHGMFVTDGNYPKPFELGVGQYLAELEIPRNRQHHSQHAIAMFYHAEAGEIFVSLRAPHTPVEHVWTRSLVFNEKYTKWCSFDQPHRWIGPVNFTKERASHLSFGFIHADHAVRYFDQSRQNADLADDCACVPLPLDSYIEIGPIALSDGQFISRTTELQKYRLHTGPMTATEAELERMATLKERDAYEEHTDTWSNYHAYSASTTDGYTIVNSQWDGGMPVGMTYYSQDYRCDHAGVAHTVKLSADTVGQYYELQRVDYELFVTSIDE